MGLGDLTSDLTRTYRLSDVLSDVLVTWDTVDRR